MVITHILRLALALQLLLFLRSELLVNLGPTRRLIAVRLGKVGRVPACLFGLLFVLLFNRLDALGVGNVVGEGAFVLGVETLVGVGLAGFEALAGLGVTWRLELNKGLCKG